MFENLTTEKGNRTRNKKPRETTNTFNEVLDGSTVDDMLDNAEEILENVEDLLESLSSQLMDSDDGIH